MRRGRKILVVLFFVLASCTMPGNDAQSEALTITHTFDYATHAPSRLSIMFTMAWFGISQKDPQTPAGSDPSGYHNWAAGGTPCAGSSPDPTTSSSCILEGQYDKCTATGALQRNITSRRRPLTGIWSGTGRDTESQRKIDLMLAMLRRPGCRADDGAKLDAWTMQNNSIKFSSKYVSNPSPAADYPYRTMMALFARADAAGIPNAVIPGFDETWYFNFGTSVGLGKCDDSANNPRSKCINALVDDLADLALEAKKHSSALFVNGKPVIFVYTDSYHPTAPRYDEWRDTVLPGARSKAGFDFYAIGVDSDPRFFQAFDALAPWLAFSAYQSTSTIYADSYSHAQKRHQNLIASVGSYPGRLVYGGVTPGFDDWTRNWSSTCMERQMPTNAPRDPQFLTAQKDFFTSCKKGSGCVGSIAKYDFRGFIGETWDDWTEGSEFEPDVYEGPDKLVRLRGLFGSVFGDAYPDAAGDARLAQRWTSYGQARNGKGGAAGVSPVTDLSCDGTTAPANAVVIDTPQNDSTQAGRIHVTAREVTPQVADAMQVYVDGALAATAQGETIDADVPSGGAPLAPGVHRVGVKAWYAGTPSPILEYFVNVTTDPVAEIMPSDGATVAHTVHVLGRDNVDGQTASAMQVYLDGVLSTTIQNPSYETLDRMLAIAQSGTHEIAVKSWYGSTSLFTEHTVNVSTAPVVLTLPVDGSSVHGPVFVQGADNGGKSVTAMQVYLDDVVAATAQASTIEVHVPATSGSHRFVVKSWYADQTTALSSQSTVNVQ